jgi:hypothetical protein
MKIWVFLKQMLIIALQVGTSRRCFNTKNIVTTAPRHNRTTQAQFADPAHWPLSARCVDAHTQNNDVTDG